MARISWCMVLLVLAVQASSEGARPGGGGAGMRRVAQVKEDMDEEDGMFSQRSLVVVPRCCRFLNAIVHFSNRESR